MALNRLSIASESFPNPEDIHFQVLGVTSTSLSGSSIPLVTYQGVSRHCDAGFFYKEFRSAGVPPQELGERGDIYIDTSPGGLGLFGRLESWKKWNGPLVRHHLIHHPFHSDWFLWCSSRDGAGWHKTTGISVKLDNKGVLVAAEDCIEQYLEKGVEEFSTLSKKRKSRGEPIEGPNKRSTRDDLRIVEESIFFPMQEFMKSFDVLALPPAFPGLAAVNRSGGWSIPFSHFWGFTPPVKTFGRLGDIFFVISFIAHQILVKTDDWVEWLGLGAGFPLELIIEHPTLPGNILWIDNTVATWISRNDYLANFNKLQQDSACSPSRLNPDYCASELLQSVPLKLKKTYPFKSLSNGQRVSLAIERNRSENEKRLLREENLRLSKEIERLKSPPKVSVGIETVGDYDRFRSKVSENEESLLQEENLRLSKEVEAFRCRPKVSVGVETVRNHERECQPQPLVSSAIPKNTSPPLSRNESDIELNDTSQPTRDILPTVQDIIITEADASPNSSNHSSPTESGTPSILALPRFTSPGPSLPIDLSCSDTEKDTLDTTPEGRLEANGEDELMSPPLVIEQGENPQNENNQLSSSLKSNLLPPTEGDLTVECDAVRGENPGAPCMTRKSASISPQISQPLTLKNSPSRCPTTPPPDISYDADLSVTPTLSQPTKAHRTEDSPPVVEPHKTEKPDLAPEPEPVPSAPSVSTAKLMTTHLNVIYHSASNMPNLICRLCLLLDIPQVVKYPLDTPPDRLVQHYKLKHAEIYHFLAEMTRDELEEIRIKLSLSTALPR